MCFSFEISLGTFITSWSIAIFLLNQKLSQYEYHLVILLMIFSSMQLVDAILWYNKNKKNNLNYYLTSIVIPFILSAQIFYNIVIINKIRNIFILTFLCITCIYMFVKLNGYTTILCNNKFNSPIWGGNEFKLWELIIFAILLLYPRYNWLIFWILFLVIMVKLNIVSGYGSMWCAIANIFAFYVLFKFYIFKMI